MDSMNQGGEVKKSGGGSLITILVVIAIIAIAYIAFAGNKDKKEDAMMTNQENESGEMMQEDKSGDEAMMQKDEAMIKAETSMEIKSELPEAGAMMSKSGSYEMYSSSKLAMAETGDVVLFFKASWCPSCRTLDADIKANASKIPEGLTILEVDYDDSTDMKKKYGVTTQHTLVQVDKDGNLIKKWTGSGNLVALAAEVK